jgi:hypothetical protein
LFLATAGDVIVVSALAVGGLLMAPVAVGYVTLALAIAAAFMFVMDPVKVAVLRRFGLTAGTCRARGPGVPLAATG